MKALNAYIDNQNTSQICLDSYRYLRPTEYGHSLKTLKSTVFFLNRQNDEKNIGFLLVATPTIYINTSKAAT